MMMMMMMMMMMTTTTTTTIKVDFREIGWTHWIHLAWVRYQWYALAKTVTHLQLP
jgi:hypothetical protein